MKLIMMEMNATHLKLHLSDAMVPRINGIIIILIIIMWYLIVGLAVIS